VEKNSRKNLSIFRKPNWNKAFGLQRARFFPLAATGLDVDAQSRQETAAGA
jgi:hypothetical protein